MFVWVSNKTCMKLFPWHNILLEKKIGGEVWEKERERERERGIKREKERGREAARERTGVTDYKIACFVLCLLCLGFVVSSVCLSRVCYGNR